MSEHTATAGVQALLAVDLDPEQLGFEMLALLEACDFEYERWCRVLGLDPDADASLEAYDQAFYTYPRVWTSMGEREFGKAMTDSVAKWQRLVY